MYVSELGKKYQYIYVMTTCTILQCHVGRTFMYRLTL